MDESTGSSTPSGGGDISTGGAASSTGAAPGVSGAGAGAPPASSGSTGQAGSFSPSAGDDTAAGTTGTGDNQAGLASIQAPVEEVPEYWKTFPTEEELRAQGENRFAKALESIRGPHSELLQKSKELESQVGQFKPVLDKVGTVENLVPMVELSQKLFTRVPDPQNPGNFLRNPVDGTPVLDTKPFLTDLQKLSRNTYYQLVEDALNAPWGEDTAFNAKLRSMGLDPARVEDYKRWQQDSSLLATSNAVDPSELKDIPPELHEAYKSYTKQERDDLRQAGALARDRYLRDRAAALENTKANEQKAEQERVAQQQAQQRFVQGIVAKQQENMAIIRKENFGILKNQLAQNWKPSTDEARNAAQRSYVMGTLVCLIDPDLRGTVEEDLKSAGIEIPQEFDSIINTIQTRGNQYIEAQAYGDQLEMNAAKADVDTAQLRLRSLLSGIQKQMTMVLDGQVRENSQNRDALLSGAGSRETPTSSGGQTTQPNAANAVLPSGLRPGTIEATRYIMEQQRLREQASRGQ